ncbi:uncharacterized protein BDV17DRAFT_260588 [Aspergillus undulatus]|uniref:uncharacterized protein n=1 Tax=Aspergillus undulatus TaxID=1810928 RepID=UPI003CCCBF46
MSDIRRAKAVVGGCLSEVRSAACLIRRRARPSRSGILHSFPLRMTWIPGLKRKERLALRAFLPFFPSGMYLWHCRKYGLLSLTAISSTHALAQPGPGGY